MKRDPIARCSHCCTYFDPETKVILHEFEEENEEGQEQVVPRPAAWDKLDEWQQEHRELLNSLVEKAYTKYHEASEVFVRLDQIDVDGWKIAMRSYLESIAERYCEVRTASTGLHVDRQFLDWLVCEVRSVRHRKELEIILRHPWMRSEDRSRFGETAHTIALQVNRDLYAQVGLAELTRISQG